MSIPTLSTDQPNDRGRSPSKGQTILGWWLPHIGERSSSSAKALSARLRRGTAIEALAEPAVHALAKVLDLKRTAHDTEVLVRLALVLAWVREHEPGAQQRLAQKLGKKKGQDDKPLMSHLRFQRLIRAEGDEIVTALRRALPLTQYRCNVAALGEDLLYWNDQTRTRWSFDYFGAEPPLNPSNPTDSQETSA